MKSLIDACLGLSSLDLLISGRIVDVYSGSVTEGYVGVKEGLIVYVGRKPKPAREFMGFPSEYILPAYIDGHIHIESSLMTPKMFARAVIPHGTCCVIADPHEIANVMGLEGIKFMIEDAAKSPLKTYFMIPSSVPSTDLETAGAEIGLKEIEILKGFRQILGLGEVMNYKGVISGEKNILEKLRACSGMIIDGHAPGLRGDELRAYMLAGVKSDHEVISLDEAWEKLSLGMWLMIREGSTAKSISKLIKVVSRGSPERAMFVTDDRHAGDILMGGHMDNCLRKAVEAGLDPIDAVRMVTIKPAEYFRLKNLGGLSPGKSADITIVNNLREFRAEMVLIDGRVVAKDGKYLGEETENPLETTAEATVKRTVKIGRLKPEDLRIKHPSKEWGEATVRVIGVVKDQIVTEELHYEMSIIHREVPPDPKRDLLKICVVERHKRTGRIGRGFVFGFGLKAGALASTIAHDSHNIVAVGVNDESIYSAVRRLREINGGLIVTDGRKVLEDLSLPIAGLMAEADVSEIAAKMMALERAAVEIGCRIRNPFMALSFLSLPVVPKLRLTDFGLVDAENLKIVNLFVD